jgi:hypothetical protein
MVQNATNKRQNRTFEKYFVVWTCLVGGLGRYVLWAVLWKRS